MGKRLFTIIEDKFNALKGEISKESRNRYESIENLKNYLENDFPKLNEMVRIEQNQREDKDDDILMKIIDEFSKYNSIYLILDQKMLSNQKEKQEKTPKKRYLIL
jgi:hypothetical protein